MGFLSDNLNVQAGVTRSLNSPFVVDALKAADVAYTIELSLTALAGGNPIQVDLQISAPMGTFFTVSSAKMDANILTGLLSLGVLNRQVVSAWVPIGYSVQMVSSGTGTASIVEQTEVTF